MTFFILQLHITNKCNKRCSHCYQENYQQTGLSLDKLFKITDDFLELVHLYNLKNNTTHKPQINLTGGEPFVRDDIFLLLDYFKTKKICFAILSNGSLFTDKLLIKLKSYNPKFIQVSIEGSKKTNDSIRGANAYNETLKALKLLKKYNIFSMVSFTANNLNYKEFPLAIKLAQKGQADKIWTDRYVPKYGEDSLIKTLNKYELTEYINIIKKEQTSLKNKFFRTKILGDRSLHFLNGHSTSYTCNAGGTLIIIIENGDVMACRRLDIVVGNIKVNSLKDIYYNSLELKKLRRKVLPKGCENCKLINLCFGGAKCISYGIYKNYNIGDYACPLKQNIKEKLQ